MSCILKIVLILVFQGISATEQPVKITGKPESRYGFAVENAGDLNQDGFPGMHTSFLCVQCSHY